MPHDIADGFPERKPVDRRSIADLAQARLDSLAKPPGALGHLEKLAVRLAVASNSISPQTSPRSLVVFAADHGAVASGVSLWPQSVTSAIAKTLVAGKAAASVMAATAGATFRLVDVGMATRMSARPNFIDASIRACSRNMSIEPALTPEEFEAALTAGADAAKDAIRDGAKLLVAGEVGIGNTTASAALTALLCQAPPSQVVGAGAGANHAVLAAKQTVIETALERAKSIQGPVARLASVSGLEIAAMAGFYLEAARQSVPVILDGAISGAAALIAQALDPGATDSMIASHMSAEPAHALALQRLGLEPFLRWEMRLGEGTGAIALLPLIDMAAAILCDMATLDEALALANE